MSYKIIVDSCGELTKEMKDSGIFESVALGIEIGTGRIFKESVRKSGMPKIIMPITGTIYRNLPV